MSKYSFANYFVSHVHVKKGKKFRKKKTTKYVIC